MEALDEKAEKKISKDFKISYYICCFAVISIIGWIFEITEEFVRGRGFTNRGFLYGSYLPIYGMGAILIYFVLNRLMKKRIKIWKINSTPIIIFMAVLIITSVFEYVSSWSLEMIFNQRWWDYSYEKFNLNGRIFLKNIILISIAGTVFLYGLEPLIKRLISKVNTKVLNYIAILITVIISIDLIITLIGHWK